MTKPTAMDYDSVSFLGAALNSVTRNVPKFEVLFADFPRVEELWQVADDQRYPLSLYIAMTDFMEAQYGYGAMLKLGRDVGRTVVDVSLSKLEIHSVTEAIQAIQTAHEYFCRPTVGAFAVEQAEPGNLFVSYTAPYNCKLQEGLLAVIAETYGAANALVGHVACRRTGAPACRYRISYSAP